MILFLELDVLNHPEELQWETHPGTERRIPVCRAPAGRSKYFYGPEFAAIMAPFLSQTEIVVTDWGIPRQEDIECAALSTELSTRIVDVIWLLDLEEYRSDLVDLHGSIRFWLNRRRPKYAGPWLCIDRKFHSWPERERHRLIVAGGLGHPDLRASIQRQIQMAYADAGYSKHQAGS